MNSKLKLVEQNGMVEWSFSSRKEYADPFNEVEVSAVFTDPTGEERVVPAFWAGGNFWGLRYASHEVGRHRFHTICSDKSNHDLHDQQGHVEILPYTGDNSVLKHGPLRVSHDRRYLEHVDGTPFFWLGDTWWTAFTKRLEWPQDFELLTADRVEKGFTVIQIVAGLYPDMAPFDPRGANEAGFPWEKDYSRINPAYFDMADRRINWLVQKGLVPCIVGSWGFFMEFAGEEAMKKHWRNLVARYGAYPVVWCIAGEATMPYYTSPVFLGGEEKREEYLKKTRAGWTNVTRYLRSVDPYHHPITIHPSVPPITPPGARGQVDDPSIIDIDMLQTGHSDLYVSHGIMPGTLANTINSVVDSFSKSPRMPVLVGEVCYEGIMCESWENVQRLMFWTSILNGACGHTYGANGIWQLNTRETPFGPSPHGFSWGDTPWEEAYQLQGSRQVGLGKRLLERYPWWRFEPHPEWVEPHWSKGDYYKPHAAGIPKEVRIAYIPLVSVMQSFLGGFPKVKGIEPKVVYHAFYFNPRDGREYDLGTVVPDEKGEWQPARPPIIQDWILVMEARR